VFRIHNNCFHVALSASDFYNAYYDVLPKAAGFEKRHRLYQLFHLLNHYVICAVLFLS
jgi:fructosamine-3-kinase